MGNAPKHTNAYDSLHIHLAHADIQKCILHSFVRLSVFVKKEKCSDEIDCVLINFSDLR